MNEEIKWIDALSEPAIALASHVWKKDPAETWGILSRAIKNEELSSHLPLTEFQDYIRLFIPPISIQPALPISINKVEIDDEWISNLKSRAQKLQKQEVVNQSKEVTGGLEELRYNLYKEHFDAIIEKEKKETGFSAYSFEKRKSINPLFLWGSAISVILYFIFIASSVSDLINGMIITIVASFFLYHSHISGKIRPTFRSNLIFWFMLLVGIAIVLDLHN